VGRSAAEELRWLEYGQRLLRRERNVAADPATHAGSTAARLFERMQAGGAAAAGLSPWGLKAGARADLLVLDTEAEGLQGVHPEHLLDAWLFATNRPALREVWVAGRRRVTQGSHANLATFATSFAEAMKSLHA
jgi:formimidoylglutamate deiminase